jgi:hypothetical protein
VRGVRTRGGNTCLGVLQHAFPLLSLGFLRPLEKERQKVTIKGEGREEHGRANWATLRLDFKISRRLKNYHTLCRKSPVGRKIGGHGNRGRAWREPVNGKSRRVHDADATHHSYY